jgi:predicted metalloprotease with PDZ domain
MVQVPGRTVMSLGSRNLTALLCFTALALGPARPAPAAEPIRLRVDLTEAPRRILHARLQIPVRPGPVTLFYPKWIPGEHGPTGPIQDLAGLTLSAGGKPIAWERDLVEMYAIHVVVPEGARALDVSLDFLLSGDEQGFTFGASSSSNLAVLSWNQVLLYPTGVPVEALIYEASLKIPEGWKYGTALPVARESGGWIEFKPAPLVTLIDSPVSAGRFFRTVPLAPEIAPRHLLHIAGDSREAIDMPREEEEHYSRLIRESLSLFGAHHYREYHFLYTLSDHVPFFGLEHHESSDNRGPERSLIDEDQKLRMADLLSHEFAHSWNGKYRRPADLATPNYEVPMRTDLLWVYEGLTQYLGWVLAARSGLLNPEQARDFLAETAAYLDEEPGRTWRPLRDTAISAQFLYEADRSWSGWRRSVDFYDESLLFWLEADAIIRTESKGQRSLDDFCRRFHGGASGPPTVKPYTFDDVVAAMNEVQLYDWRKFFTDRVDAVRARAPLGGITRGGWRLAYTDSASAYHSSLEKARKHFDFLYSVGLYLDDQGDVIDAWPKTPAALAGISPGMKLIAVNGKQWTEQVLHEAIRAAARSRAPIEILAKNGEFYSTHKVEYRGGERFPKLIRVEGTPDLLSRDLTPLVPPGSETKR